MSQGHDLSFDRKLKMNKILTPLCTLRKHASTYFRVIKLDRLKTIAQLLEFSKLYFVQ